MLRSDSHNKEIALGRIKRLASSGLPLEPFVRSVFELFNDAVPHSPNRSILVGGANRTDTFIGSTPETIAAVPMFHHYFVDNPEISGAKFAQDSSTIHRIFPSKPVWMHDEVFRPDFHRTEGFNEVFLTLDYRHSVVVIFQEHGEFLGYYPVWRSADQKPFSREDVAFLKVSAPHIAHGLRTAKLLTRAGTSSVDSFVPLAGWGSGVILMDDVGRPIAFDSEARAIFLQLGVFDEVEAEAFLASRLQRSLNYIAHTLRTVFFEPDAGGMIGGPPVSQIYVHWTGMVLQLRGVRMIGADCREYTVVLVQRGETPALRRRTLLSRYGISLTRGGNSLDDRRGKNRSGDRYTLAYHPRYSAKAHQSHL